MTTMKPQSVTLCLAAGGSLLFSMIVWLDPDLAWQSCIGIHLGIWAMAIGQCVTQFLIDHKTKHEKNRHHNPTP